MRAVWIVRALSTAGVGVAVLWGLNGGDPFEVTGTALAALVGFVAAEGMKPAATSIPSQPTTTPGLETPESGVLSDPDPASVAVLPFEGAGNHQHRDLFVEGIGQDVVGHLARLEGVQVTSWTSSKRFPDTEMSVGEFARTLGAQHVLEGSASFLDDSVRVSARLVDATTDTSLWSDTIERELDNVFAVMSDVATAVAENLRGSLAPGERALLDRAPTRDLAAYRALLEGRRLYNAAQIPESVAFFRQATVADPGSAEAWSGLAEALFYAEGTGYWGTKPLEARDEILNAVQRALEIDPRNPEACAISGIVSIWFDLDIDSGLLHMEQAIRNGPSSAVARFWNSDARLFAQRFDDALATLKEAVALDPLSELIKGHIPWVLAMAGRHEEAVEKYRAMREIDGPGVWSFLHGQSLIELGRAAEALPLFREAHALMPDWSFMDQMLAHGLAAAGEEAEYETKWAALLDREQREYVWPMGFAFAHVARGELEEAVVRIEESVEDRSGLIWLGCPTFGPLRSDLRYQALVRPFIPAGDPLPDWIR